MTIHDHDHHYYKLQPSPSQTKPETSLLYIIVASPSRVIDGHLGIRVLKKHSSIWHRMVAESEGPTTRQRVIQHWTLWQQVAFFNLFTLMDLFDGVFFQLSVTSSVGISSDHKPQTVVTNYSYNHWLILQKSICEPQDLQEWNHQKSPRTKPFGHTYIDGFVHQCVVFLRLQCWNISLKTLNKHILLARMATSEIKRDIYVE